jgi:outer membrane protein assembly factor BamB
MMVGTLRTVGIVASLAAVAGGVYYFTKKVAGPGIPPSPPKPVTVGKITWTKKNPTTWISSVGGYTIMMKTLSAYELYQGGVLISTERSPLGAMHTANIHYINATTGTLTWSFSAGKYVSSPPTYKIRIVSGFGTIFEVYKGTTKIGWSPLLSGAKKIAAKDYYGVAP